MDEYTPEEISNDVARIRSYAKSWLSVANWSGRTTADADDHAALTDEIKLSAKRLAKRALQGGIENDARKLLLIPAGEAFSYEEDDGGLTGCFAIAYGLNSALEDAELAALSLELSEQNTDRDAVAARKSPYSAPFEVRPREPSSVDSSPMRFDPSEWTVIGTKQYPSGLMSFDEGPEWTNEETLFTDEDHTAWIVISELWHREVDFPSDRTFDLLGADEAVEWAVDAGCDLPGSAGACLTERTLSPARARALLAPTPRWDGELLRVGSVQVATVSPRAKNLRLVLDAFEEEHWPKRIDDPLPGGCDTPDTRLRETVRTLNKKQEAVLFESDGTGEGITWKLHGSSVCENSDNSPAGLT